MEYNGALTHGDPIKLVCEFKVASPEERAAKKRELEEQIRVASNLEDENEESKSETEDIGEIPEMPDLDELSEVLKD